MAIQQRLSRLSMAILRRTDNGSEGTTRSARSARKILFVCLLSFLWFLPLNAQRGAQRGGQTAKAIAPIDLTGYWVSVVSEDWRHRMTTPRRGDLESLPLNAEGTRVANTWDLAK